jgi:CheY-like chemotaxis protein
MTAPGPILVVDDDADIRSTIADILGDAGYEVEAAANGRAALDLLKTSRAPALILLDLMMPELDGWAFMAALERELPQLAGVPVVIFSAHGDARQAATSLEVVGFVKKPIRLDELLAAVERCLGGERRLQHGSQ